MGESFDCAERGIRLYAGRLYNHDYLWFSSFEISKTAATHPAVHNYALSYAINGFSYGISAGNRPSYERDLAGMPAYATPAWPEGTVLRTRFTQNAVNLRSLRTDDAPRGSNSPSLGWRVVLDPIWRTTAGADPRAGFEFYLFAREGFRPPAVVRLGKKGCPVRLEWDRIRPAIAVRSDSPRRPTHAVNPLDVQGKILVYEPVAIPPHLILRRAEIREDWFVVAGEHVVHVPRRFTRVASAGALHMRGA